MKFKLKGKITFSKDAQKAERDIEKFIDFANHDLFLKGIPEDQKEDASKIKRWNLDGNTLNITIESGRRGRAHDALLRMKKPLLQVMGPKYHVGVRKIHVSEYEIQIPTTKKIDLSQMPYVAEFETMKDRILIKFNDLEEGDLRRHVVDRVIKQVLTETDTIPSEGPSDILTKKVTKIEPGTIVSKSKKQKFFFEGDPTEEAAKLGWVKKVSWKRTMVLRAQINITTENY